MMFCVIAKIVTLGHFLVALEALDQEKLTFFSMNLKVLK
jgi:hypothetical protein